jgi:hypothetical protein
LGRVLWAAAIERAHPYLCLQVENGDTAMLQFSFRDPIKGEKESREAISLVNVWYAQKDNIDQVRTLAKKTRDWLIENKQKTDSRGNAISGGPWFALAAVDFTDDPDRLDLRRATLRKVGWGHGLRRLLNMMGEAPLLSDDSYDFISTATDYPAMAFHEDLMGYRLSPLARDTTVSLVEAKKRYGLSEGTSGTKIRDNLLMRMAAFGLWKVEPGKPYEIGIGPVAEIFHMDVFSPVRKKFEPLIGGTAK